MESDEFRLKVGGAFWPGGPPSPGPSNTVYNEEYVRQCYKVFLRRDPAGIVNPGDEGYGWYDYLNRTGDYHGAIGGFINSIEYRAKFGPV